MKAAAAAVEALGLTGAGAGYYEAEEKISVSGRIEFGLTWR